LREEHEHCSFAGRQNGTPPEAGLGSAAGGSLALLLGLVVAVPSAEAAFVGSKLGTSTFEIDTNTTLSKRT
jgi:hypothetical protein